MANNAKIKKYFQISHIQGTHRKAWSKDEAESLTVKSLKISEISKALPPSTVQSDKRLSKGVKGVPERTAQQLELKLVKYYFEQSIREQQENLLASLNVSW